MFKRQRLRVDAGRAVLEHRRPSPLPTCRGSVDHGAMDTIGSQTIVVGIDGSTTSDAALAWAVEEAARRGMPLHLVSAGTYQGAAPDAAHGDADIEAQVSLQALADADARVAAATSGVSASTRAMAEAVA